MTVGAAAALSITLRALSSTDMSDEVVVFTPFFPEYSVFIKNANAKVISVAPNLNTFYPDMDNFENKITKNTAAVIINSPNNPTGVYYNKSVIENICKILDKKQKEFNHPIYLISDEPYRELLYTYDKFDFITNFYDNSIITYSFSKALSIPGERVGYILVNPKCENASQVFLQSVVREGLLDMCALQVYFNLLFHIALDSHQIQVYIKEMPKYFIKN